jgi:hypothetical protein
LEQLTRLAERLADRRRHAAAAACAQIAAHHAFTNHSGVFASPRLERVLRIVGTATIRRAPRADSGHPPRRVLHVLTYARPTGGDTRFVWRWIQADPGRRHSVVVTKQGDRDVPLPLKLAVEGCNGRLHLLPTPLGALIENAQRLADIAREADVVALHLFPDDVVPALAFADAAASPTVVFVHHSDHTFWIGSSVTDLVAQLRDPDASFLRTRRGLDLERLATLPIPLEPPVRSAAQDEAKRRLGYATDDVLLLTIASPFKYQPIAGPSYLEVMVRVVGAHRNVHLLAVGPDDAGEWRDASKATGGRIVPLGGRFDTAQYYEAADVYVDSFPFSSITSLVEAGAYGVPSVSFCPHHAEARLLCAGAPGLVPKLLRECRIDEYESTLSRLIENAAARTELGEATRSAVLASHSGVGWKAALEEVYRRTAVPRQPRTMPAGGVISSHATVDQMVRCIVGRISIGLGPVIDTYAGPLPYVSRLGLLLPLLSIDRSFSLSMLLPGPLERALQGRLTWIGRRLRRATRTE